MNSLRLGLVLASLLFACLNIGYSIGQLALDVPDHFNRWRSDAVQCDRGKLRGSKYVSIAEFYDRRNKCSHKLHEDVKFFHVGKAGGGTVVNAMRLNRIGISMTHPYPKDSSVTRF